MSDIGKWVEQLMEAGCMPKVAARVVAEVFMAGMEAAPSKDPAAEKRRAWDREYRKRRNKSGGSGGNRVEMEPTQRLWTEGVGLLRQLGLPEKNARSNIGKWLKAGNDPARILELIVDVNRRGIGDPVPWITAALGNGKGSVNGRTRSLATAADDLIARAEEQERATGFGGFDEPVGRS